MDKSISGTVNAVLNPSLTAKTYALIGRGVKEIKLNNKNELIFVMNDGYEYNLGGLPDQSIPVASETILGGIKVGSSLKIKDGILSVDTVTDVLKDNTKPVTSGAVYMQIGNIEVLLQNI